MNQHQRLPLSAVQPAEQREQGTTLVLVRAILRWKLLTALKPKVCSHCLERIHVGELYARKDRKSVV